VGRTLGAAVGSAVVLAGHARARAGGGGPFLVAACAGGHVVVVERHVSSSLCIVDHRSGVQVPRPNVVHAPAVDLCGDASGKVPGLRCFTRSDQGTLRAAAGAAKEAAAMTTGSFEGNTTRDVASSDRPVGVLANYKALWALLLLGWIVSYADRTLTGPVVAWMIQNKAGFIGDSANPAALGGLVGSMFFLGYMLTQYPGGRLGDRFGHREMIIVSLLWAAVLTAV